MPDPVTHLNAALQGRYTIERELGEGGMATVYLADDLKHERRVALKVLKPDLAAVLGAERFLAEIKTTANLQHPHILPLFDSGSADAFLYYVMPYVAGETLKHKLDREGQLRIEECLAIGRSVAAALHYAHGQNVVHRDIKPENVMLSDGLPVVADFGIAGALDAARGDRLTRTGLSLGTPGYQSPEQAAGDPVDARSDVYALGCLMFEMVTGQPPYQGPTAQAVLAKLFTEPVPSARGLREGVPETLDAALRRALAKEPGDRFATAAEMATALVGGSTEPVPIREALAIAPAKRTPFVARDQERARLMAALDDAVEGHGSLVLVGGEPGVGKTRLAEEILLEAQRRELLCFIGHCYEGEGSVPYTPFVETLEYAMRALPEDLLRQTLGDAAPEVARIMPKLRQLFPDIPPAIELPPEQRRRYLFNSYREFIERGALISPLVVLLDDLHWADEGSLLLLEHLAQHIPTQRMLIIGTYRDVELEVTRPFAKTLSDLTRQRLAQRIMIRRLSEESAADLLAALGGPGPPVRLATSIFHETEGNPFFVEEVFRDLDEDGKLFDASGAWLSDLDVDHLEVPEGVRLVIGRRLDRVGEDVQKVLTAGAVVGRRFSLRILEALEQLSGDALFDALEDAEGAHLIQASAEGRDPHYKFSHELIRQTLVGRLSIPRRQRLHLRISGAMEEVYGSRIEDHAADYSYHLYQAGAAADPEVTIRFLALAGEQALEAAAFEEALEHFELGLSVVEDPEPRQLAGLLLKKGSALHGLGDWPAMLEAWNTAVPLFEELGESEAVAQMCEEAGIVLAWMGRVDESKEIANRGLEAIGTKPSVRRGRLLALLGLMTAATNDPAGGLVMLDDSAQLGRELEDEALLGYALQMKSLAFHNHARFAAAIEVGADGAVEALRHVNDGWNLVQLLSIMEYDYLISGRVSQALALSPEVRQLADELGHVGAALMDDVTTGTAEYFLPGDLRGWTDWAERNIDGWLSAGPWAHWGRIWAAHGKFLLGDWDDARADAARATKDFPADNYWAGYFPAAELLIDAYAGTGNPAELFRLNYDRLPEPGEPTVGGDRLFALLATEALAVIGDREACASLYSAALDTVEGGVTLWFSGLGQRYLGISAACGERWDVAERHFQIALEQAHELPVRSEQPEVRRWYARMLLDRRQPGDEDRARELLDEAILMYQEIGMPRHLEMAREML